MDPDVALTELRNLVGQYRTISGTGDLVGEAIIADQLAETFDNLDTWITGGGFLPAAWTHAPAPT